MKHVREFALAVMSSLILSAACSAQSQRDLDWQEDLTFFAEELEARHIDLYHTVSAEQFQDELQQLAARVEVLNDHQIVVELMRITRLVGDGHTQFPAMGGPHNHFPLNFIVNDGEVWVTASTEAHNDLLGMRLISVDGHAMSGLLRRLEPLVQPAETPSGLLFSLAFHLTIDEFLYGAGVTERTGQARFVFEAPDGLIVERQITSVPMEIFSGAISHRLRVLPEAAEHDLHHSPGLWLQLDQEARTARLHFAHYPGFEEMAAFAAEARRLLDQSNIRNLVIDLRDNGGGDFFIGLVLASELLLVESLDWRSGIYALIGRHTFSAGMSNAAQFRQILNATLVGEPTGGRPAGYGEGGMFRLPNSGRMVMYSKRRYRFEQESDAGIVPDIFVRPDIDALRDGEDTAMAWIEADIQSRR